MAVSEFGAGARVRAAMTFGRARWLLLALAALPAGLARAQSYVPSVAKPRCIEEPPRQMGSLQLAWTGTHLAATWVEPCTVEPEPPPEPLRPPRPPGPAHDPTPDERPAAAPARAPLPCSLRRAGLLKPDLQWVDGSIRTLPAPGDALALDGTLAFNGEELALASLAHPRGACNQPIYGCARALVQRFSPTLQPLGEPKWLEEASAPHGRPLVAWDAPKKTWTVLFDGHDWEKGADGNTYRRLLSEVRGGEVSTRRLEGEAVPFDLVGATPVLAEDGCLLRTRLPPGVKQVTLERACPGQPAEQVGLRAPEGTASSPSVARSGSHLAVAWVEVHGLGGGPVCEAYVAVVEQKAGKLSGLKPVMVHATPAGCAVPSLFADATHFWVSTGAVEKDGAMHFKVARLGFDGKLSEPAREVAAWKQAVAAVFAATGQKLYLFASQWKDATCAASAVEVGKR